MTRRVVVLDHGYGNVHSAAAALARVGADVEITADPHTAEAADGLYVPGVGAFRSVVTALRRTRGDRVIGRRVAGGRPVLAVCVGLQVLFEVGDEREEGDDEPVDGLAQWPGRVERLPGTGGARVPHMGWNTVRVPAGSTLFDGVAGERFYFVHSYAARDLPWDTGRSPMAAPLVTTAEHGTRFVAAVEHGPLAGTQFHPEKSGEVGLHLLATWVGGLN